MSPPPARLAPPQKGVSFSVPTGNFGDILAGYYASKMGVPIHKLLIATNENDILTRCHQTGIYQKSAVSETLSPSMDIQISSNFERLLFDFSGRDASMVNQMMADLRQNGAFTLTPDMKGCFQGIFGSGRCDNAQTLETIKNVYAQTGQLIDPHTAIGIHVAQQNRDPHIPMISLACASAAKFPDTVYQATGQMPPLPEFLSDLHDRPERIIEIENDIDAFKSMIS